MLSRFSASRKVGKLSFFIAIVSITGLAFSNTQTFASSSFKSAADPYSGKLVYWFWAESDVPGSTAWMQAAIKRYEALHKNISIELVPQGSDTLQGAFETTAQTLQPGQTYSISATSTAACSGSFSYSISLGFEDTNANKYTT